MSKQLSVSAAFSILAMAGFALFSGQLGAADHPSSTMGASAKANAPIIAKQLIEAGFISD